MDGTGTAHPARLLLRLHLYGGVRWLLGDNDYRARFPELALMGGIDKRLLAMDAAAIDAELDRVWPAVQKGRYIPDLDHLIPDNVPWTNYQHYCHELKRRVTGIA